ncbi:hypothetical protein GALL_393260 [mine drainage metagenome]|uniref:Uncharacterized protein n=1 Tax=mine drainage metagenome TaxID=410659 RepID=A0A1J5Q5I5_9ZZZZ
MPTSNTIDTAMARRLAEASAIRGASTIGQPGGWSVVLKFGLQERPLGAQRTDKPRTWRSLDRAVAYVKDELHIARFDLLDATNHTDGEPMAGRTRADASERLRHAHQAAAHDKWFRAEVEQGIKEANDPNTQWISNDDVKKSWAKQRAKWAKRAGGAA